ncbi:hypothetical protein OSTOST_25276, partial [Ostertagia ostertagi]
MSLSNKFSKKSLPAESEQSKGDNSYIEEEDLDSVEGPKLNENKENQVREDARRGNTRAQCFTKSSKKAKAAMESSEGAQNDSSKKMIEGARTSEMNRFKFGIEAIHNKTDKCHNTCRSSPSKLEKQESSDAVTSSMKNKRKRKKKKSGVQKTAVAVENPEGTHESAVVASAKKEKNASGRDSNEADTIAGSNGKPSPLLPPTADKFKEILEKLADVLDTQEARRLINEEVSAGRIEKIEFMTVMQRWRQQKRKKIQTLQRDKVVEMEGSLDDV